MKRTKSNNVKTNVNSKVDAEISAKSWLLWSMFTMIMVLMGLTIYSVLKI